MQFHNLSRFAISKFGSVTRTHRIQTNKPPYRNNRHHHHQEVEEASKKLYLCFRTTTNSVKKTSQDHSSKDAQRTTSNFQITTIPTPTSTTQSQTYRFSTHLLTYVVTKSPLTSTQLPTLSASLFMPRFTHPVIHTTTNNPENTETGQLGRILC